MTVVGRGEAGDRDRRGSGRPPEWSCVGWDPAVDEPPEALQFAGSAAAVVAHATAVLSVNAAAVALDVAAESALSPGQLYADLNAAAPALKVQLAGVSRLTGALVDDLALMRPGPGRGLRTPALASGPGAARFVDVFGGLGMPVHVVGDEPGDAAARSRCAPGSRRASPPRRLRASPPRAQRAVRSGSIGRWPISSRAPKRHCSIVCPAAVAGTPLRRRHEIDAARRFGARAEWSHGLRRRGGPGGNRRRRRRATPRGPAARGDRHRPLPTQRASGRGRGRREPWRWPLGGAHRARPARARGPGRARAPSRRPRPAGRRARGGGDPRDARGARGAGRPPRGGPRKRVRHRGPARSSPRCAACSTPATCSAPPIRTRCCTAGSSRSRGTPRRRG